MARLGQRAGAIGGIVAGALGCLASPAFAQHKAAPAAQAAQAAAETPQAAVDAADALLKAGKSEAAVDRLTAAISGGKLSSKLLARALYLRGSAYRVLAKPAQAIADLTNALFIKDGLGAADRADAAHQRASAYIDAGLGDHGNALAAAAPATPAVTPASGGAWSATTAPVKPVQARPTPPVQPAPQTASAAITHAAPHAAIAAGHYRTRIALVRTAPEAEAVVAKLKSAYRHALGDKAPDVGQVSFGSMGTFYQVSIGPYPTEAAAAALCGKLHGSGFDCVAIDR